MNSLNQVVSKLLREFALELRNVKVEKQLDDELPEFPGDSKVLTTSLRWALSAVLQSFADFDEQEGKRLIRVVSGIADPVATNPYSKFAYVYIVCNSAPQFDSIRTMEANGKGHDHLAFLWRDLIDGMGGNIEVYSEEHLMGFRVSVPCDPMPLAPSMAVAAG